MTTLDAGSSEVGHAWPSLLPDDDHFVYAARRANGSSTLVLGSLRDPSVRQALAGGARAVYVSPGYLVYVHDEHDRNLVVRAFDATTLRFVGVEQRLEDRAQWSFAGVTGVFAPAFSSVSTRVLTYGTEPDHSGDQLVWFDRSGRRLGTVGEPGDYANPALSGDGRYLAFDLLDQRTQTRDIWLHDMERGSASRLTFDKAGDFNPVFSADASEVLLSSERRGTRAIYRKPVGGLGEEQLFFADARGASVCDWSADGRLVVYETFDAENKGDLWPADVNAQGAPVPFMNRPGISDFHPQISPNGRFLAYASNETGRPEVYITDFPFPRTKWRVSIEGGTEPRWRRDGQELYYTNGSRFMAVNVAVAPGDRELRTGTPQLLFERRFTGRPIRNHYVAAADGQRFLFVVPGEPAHRPPLTLLLDWR